MGRWGPSLLGQTGDSKKATQKGGLEQYRCEEGRRREALCAGRAWEFADAGRKAEDRISGL